MEGPLPLAANAPQMSRDFKDATTNPRCYFISKMNYIFKTWIAPK